MKPVIADVCYLNSFLTLFVIGIVCALNYFFITGILFYYSFVLSVSGGLLMGFSAGKLKARFEGRGW